ncbi:hypothetical protein B0H19DRAFT_430504 [Mycena capillaripes]|nr:hypothetical protein B0H19DRAFT_430504 [Mycena capillaripes]
MDNIGTQQSCMGRLWGSRTGLMGDSEQASVHWRSIGQDIVSIDVAIKKRALNETILASHKRAKDSNGRLHLLGARRSRRRPL